MTRTRSSKSVNETSKDYLSLSGKPSPVDNKPKKRFNKNKKKNWKNIDITQIEDALEGERLEKRTTGTLSSKRNDELFFIESKVSDGALESSKREKLRYKRLLIDELLVPNPERVKAPTNVGLAKLRKQEKSKAMRATKRKAASMKQKSILSTQVSNFHITNL